MSVSDIDVSLMHPPSIYDFRKRDIKTGPISDVVPSTPVFEMYPIGFVSMLGHLIRNGFRARISNLAVLMLSEKKFDVANYIKRINASIYGVDFHWLPHVHGAREITKLIKEIHPDAKVVLGGFSSTYFRKEIMKEWPWVDFVLYGDYQEGPLAQLTDTVQKGGDLSQVPSLIYRDSSGNVKETAQESSILGMSRVFIDYKTLANNTIKYHDIKGHIPYYSWIDNPEGFTLIEHGCQYNCGFCGGSNFAYKGRYGTISPVFRDPDKVALEIELVDETIGAPTFVSGDLNVAGEKYYNAFFRAIRERGLDIPLLSEYFVPPNRQFLESLSRTFTDFTAEISPESSIERVRRRTGKLYTNAELEKSIGFARDAGCKKFDVYFSIGLPTQTRDDVYADVEYSSKIMEEYNNNGMDIYSFISPLTPFLDPGSLFFEKPELYGYTILFRRLNDFYNALDKGKSWEDYLNYETDKMTKENLIETTYLAGIKMIELSSKMKLIDGLTSTHLISNIHDYLSGNPYIENREPSKHLAYVNKQIEWSRKHRLTFTSFMILLYKYYNMATKPFRV